MSKHFKGIVTSDWHLRKDVPISRPENEQEWIDFQFNTIQQLIDFAMDKDCPIFQIGDIFHRSQPYYGIVGRLKQQFEEHQELLYKIAGNHDLPYHSFDNVLNSGWYCSPGIEIKDVYKGAFHFGTDPTHNKSRIVFTHQLIFPDDKSRPINNIGKTASELLEEFPNATYIFTGDYHKNFHYEENGRHVINSGCLTRQKAGEIDYTCGFYYVDTKEGIIEYHKFKDDVVMVRDHIEVVKERESRLDAFMELIGDTKKVTFSFTKNLTDKLNNKKVPNSVRNIISEIETEINVGVSK